MHIPSIFLITIDGPAGVGKSTIAKKIATHCTLPVLGSGTIYRLVALQALQHNVVENVCEVTKIAQSLSDNWLEQAQQQAHALHNEKIAKAASHISTYPTLRTALLSLQQQCAIAPGLVAEGRDMGTVVFPHAHIKFFITAQADIRAKRRCWQQGITPSSTHIATITSQLKERDTADSTRTTSPLVAAHEALTIDTSHQHPDETLATMINMMKMRFPQIPSL